MNWRRHRCAIATVAVLLTACSGRGEAATESTAAWPATATTLASSGAAPSSTIATTVANPPVTSTISTSTISTSTISTSTISSPTISPVTTAAPTTDAAPTTTIRTAIRTTTPYGLPLADAAHAGYSRQHHDYPASDVFVPGGCGSQIISPVNGVILEARRVDSWDSRVDNPATRGGKSVAILGDDGVRYYLAHFGSIAEDIEPGVRVDIGHPLGLMGMTGRAGACHVHFAISPQCPGPEWSIRRGVIWPWRYFDAWRAGVQLSPLAEIERWIVAHPDACADAMADPNAADS